MFVFSLDGISSKFGDINLAQNLFSLAGSKPYSEF